jgi:hypothetical protein
MEPAIEEVTYLLTWNCKHLANATMRSTIEDVCRSEGLKPPIICTPEELPTRKPS